MQRFCVQAFKPVTRSHVHCRNICSSRSFLIHCLMFPTQFQAKKKKKFSLDLWCRSWKNTSVFNAQPWWWYTSREQIRTRWFHRWWCSALVWVFFCWFCFLLGVCHVVNIKFKNWKQQRGFRVKTYTNNRIKRRSGGRVRFFKVVRSHSNLTSVLLSLTHVCGLVKVWWSASFHWPTPVSHWLWYWMVHFPSSPSSGGWIFLAHSWFKVWLAGSLQYW